MATRTPTGSIDIQQLVSGALKLEVKLLNAGVDTMRVYLNQAARFSNLASEALQDVQDDKATLAGTARKLTDFARQNAQTFTDLSQRLAVSYYDELDRLVNGALKPDRAGTRPAVQVSHAAKASQPAAKRPSATRRKAPKRA